MKPSSSIQSFSCRPAILSITTTMLLWMMMMMMLSGFFMTTASAFQGVSTTCNWQPTHHVPTALAMMLDIQPPLLTVVVPAPVVTTSWYNSKYLFPGSTTTTTLLVPATTSTLSQQPQHQILPQGTGLSMTIMDHTPSTILSIQEYRKPTAEELAQKKLNFNLIFWGGGFVAPFLATIFYFGARFWEK